VVVIITTTAAAAAVATTTSTNTSNKQQQQQQQQQPLPPIDLQLATLTTRSHPFGACGARNASVSSTLRQEQTPVTCDV
jgi:hypothetical protein